MATALAKLIAFIPQTQDKARKLRILTGGPICKDCGNPAAFLLGPDAYCGPCAVKLAVRAVL